MRIRLTLAALFLVWLMTKTLWIPPLARLFPVPMPKHSPSGLPEFKNQRLDLLIDTSFDVTMEDIAHRVAQGSPVELPPHRFIFVRHLDNISGAASDGTILVGANGIKYIQRHEELAGLLAHEFAHVIDRDHLRGRIWVITEAYTQWLLAGDNRHTLKWFNLRLLAYLRTIEQEADGLAFRMLQGAHISTTGLVDFFMRRPSRQEKQNYFEILSTHPMDARRAEHLKNLEILSPSLPILPLGGAWIELKDHAEKQAT